ncbi:hypothetical protein HKBW3C_01634, partial [Candidatus Hakubella thermalkaliphila]
GFGKERAEMSAQLKADLAQAEAERVRQAQEEARERAAEVPERRAEVSEMLEGFGKERAEMSAQLKADLAQAEAERVRQAQEEARERAAEVPERRAEVSEMLEGFRKEQAETAAAWRDLVATMRAKRTGVPLRVVPPEEVKMAVVEEAEAVEEREEAEAVEKVEEAEAAEEAEEESYEEKTLEEQIFAFVNSHPEGIKLVDMERALEAPRIRLGVVAKKLVEEGRIKKEGPLYIPVR